jgi:hypothetical protein
LTTLNSIIEVNIVRGSAAVTRAAFNIPLFADVIYQFPERARVYSTLEAVQADFASTTNVYKAASQLFGQTIKPPKIVVGRKAVTSITITPTASSVIDELYSVKIEGTNLSPDDVEFVTTLASSTPTQICTGLTTAFNNLDANEKAGITWTNNGSTITVTSNAGGLFAVRNPTSNIALSAAATAETWADALTTILNANSEWFALTASTHIKADQIVIADWIKSQERMYFTSTSDSSAKGSTTTDIGYYLTDNSIANACVMWHSDADTIFPECAFVGRNLPAVPGSNTWKFKALAGVPSSNLNDTEILNLKGKNYNIVQKVAGNNITEEGVTTIGLGEFIDTMILVFWTAARMRERIFFRLINTEKIPYTAAGFAIIEAEVRAVLTEGVTNGGYASYPPFSVSIPKVQTIEPNLRAQRRLESVSFEATLTSAVHFVKISGKVVV